MGQAEAKTNKSGQRIHTWLRKKQADMARLDHSEMEERVTIWQEAHETELISIQYITNEGNGTHVCR